jgi:hypothetical protein
MPLRNLSVFSFLLIVVFLSGCSKDGSPNLTLFYGAWKTSYGDTIVFARENGRNVLNYDYSMNPAMPSTTKSDFNYAGNKLGLKNDYSLNQQFHTLQSFTWVQEGKVFTVQGIEWFNFLSSTTTYFTFTKIQ